MSYGVVAWKVGNVRVEDLRTPASKDAPRVTPWGAGRLALTALHLTFVPARAGSGVGPLTLALTDIVAVQTSTGHLHRIVSFRTADTVVHTRVPGASAFARRVSLSVEAARKRQSGSPGGAWTTDPFPPHDHTAKP